LPNKPLTIFGDVFALFADSGLPLVIAKAHRQY
jgi:hypothetical protein